MLAAALDFVQSGWIFGTERAVENKKEAHCTVSISTERTFFFREAEFPSIGNFTAEGHDHVALKQLKNKQEFKNPSPFILSLFLEGGNLIWMFFQDRGREKSKFALRGGRMNKSEMASLDEPGLRKSPTLSSGEKQGCCCHCMGTVTRAAGEIYTQNWLLNALDGDPNQLTSPISSL